MNEAKHILLYDDHCPLCTFQMKMLEWVDWLDVARMVGISDPRAAKIAPKLEREELLEAIHCVAARKEGTAREDGAASEQRVHRGARALRFLGIRMPMLAPLAVILWVPGVIWIAERVYTWVSRNRHLLSRLFGCKAACQVMPKREREDGGSDEPRA